MSDGRGERLKLARKVAGKTQEAVAAHFGVAVSTVCRWESEDITPSVDQFAALAALYGVEPSDLAWGEPTVTESA